MELKRTILAVALSMAVLVLFQKYFAPPPRAPEAQAPAATGGTSAPVTPAPMLSPTGPSAPVPPTSAAPIVRAVLENNLVSVDLTSRSAAIEGARLKGYRKDLGPASAPVELLASSRGLDLAGGVRLPETNPSWGQVYEELGRSAERVSYGWTAPSGLRVEKTYSLAPDHYDVALEVRLRNGTGEAIRDRLGLLLIQDFQPLEDSYSFTGPAYFKGGDYEEVKVKAAKDGHQEAGGIAWAAMLDKYFLVAAVPAAGQDSGLRIGTHQGLEKVVEAELLGPMFELAPGADTSFAYKIYLGPKRAETLAPLGSDLEDVVHYGFFHVIAKPLMVFLNVIYEFTGNYGIAIILLTTLIKGIFWPLSAKSFKSMQRMKELQPKMQRLKEKYGKDKERMNTEVMQLYKSHKVNPMGGCLPMIVQIPFFFALYKILLGSIELRHAPFFFWIQDLSAKDPYYITPLLMGASMFLQQKMTPVTGDNAAQMKMMMYGMPAIFTFMFLNFPSGLVVYWLVNNLLSIAQQAMLLRKARPA